MNKTDSPGLAVAVLTRTGSLSGMRFAEAIAGSRHRLCGILAEPRSAMLRRALRRHGLIGVVRRYGVAFLAGRIVSWVRSRGASGGGTAAQEGSVTVVDALNSQPAMDVLREWAADIIVVANSPVLKPDVFRLSRLGAINFHSGHLPEYGGLDSEFWALYAGEKQSWITLHWVEEELDSGGILAEHAMELPPGTTPDALYEMGVERGVSLLITTLDRIEGGERGSVRTPGKAVLHPRPTSSHRRELRRRIAAHTTKR